MTEARSTDRWAILLLRTTPRCPWKFDKSNEPNSLLNEKILFLPYLPSLRREIEANQLFSLYDDPFSFKNFFRSECATIRKESHQAVLCINCPNEESSFFITEDEEEREVIAKREVSIKSWAIFGKKDDFSFRFFLIQDWEELIETIRNAQKCRQCSSVKSFYSVNTTYPLGKCSNSFIGEATLLFPKLNQLEGLSARRLSEIHSTVLNCPSQEFLYTLNRLYPKQYCFAGIVGAKRFKSEENSLQFTHLKNHFIQQTQRWCFLAVKIVYRKKLVREDKAIELIQYREGQKVLLRREKLCDSELEFLNTKLVGQDDSGEVEDQMLLDFYYRYIHRTNGKSREVSSLSKNVIRLISAAAYQMIQFDRETSLLRRLRHPSILQLHEYFRTASEFSFVMEKARGGDLWNVASSYKPKNSEHSPLPEFFVKMIVTQLLEVENYLKSKNVQHRDIKPENIFCVDTINVSRLSELQVNLFLEKLETLKKKLQRGSYKPYSQYAETNNELCNPFSPIYTVHIPRYMWPRIKLADFEYASDKELCTPCGTTPYAAPELTRASESSYLPHVDIFSIGVTTFWLLTGRFPFPKYDKTVNYAHPIIVARGRQKSALSSQQNCFEALPAIALDSVADGVKSDFLGLTEWERIASFKLLKENQKISKISLAVNSFRKLGDETGCWDIDLFVQQSELESTSCFDSQLQLLPSISKLGEEFLREALHFDPKQRLTPEKALVHPWLRDCFMT